VRRLAEYRGDDGGPVLGATLEEAEAGAVDDTRRLRAVARLDTFAGGPDPGIGRGLRVSNQRIGAFAGIGEDPAGLLGRLGFDNPDDRLDTHAEDGPAWRLTGR
jgi:hypothetical protein